MTIDTRAAIEAALVELEALPQSKFRTAAGPAVGLQRRAAELGADDLAMRARLLRANALVREGNSEQGGRWTHQVLAWAQEHDDAFLAVRAHVTLCTFYRQVGDFSEALTHAVQCYSGLTPDEPPPIRIRHLMTLALALDESGSIAEGAQRFREALEMALEAGHHELTLQILNNMAYTAFEADDEAEARRLVGQMREVKVRAGRPFGAVELDTVARIEMMGGHWDEVEATLSIVMAVGPNSAVESHDGAAPAICMLTLAEARRLNRRFAEAQEALDAAVTFTDSRGLDRVRAQAREEQAALYAATGRFAEAYEEHRAFYRASTALHSVEREARARALQAVFETTEARRSAEHFREMAYRDALTGLYNRRYANERLPEVLDDAAARGRPVSLAILDLDRFKRINDTLSHSVGDLVLQHVARLLQEEISGPMIVARIGGEEFLLVLPGFDGDEAARYCERVRLKIRAHAWEPVTGSFPVTTSIGVTTTPDGAGTPSKLLSAADSNLYRAKHAGRDRVVA